MYILNMAINYRFTLFSFEFTQKEWGMALGIEYSSRGCAITDAGVQTQCSDDQCDSQCFFGLCVDVCKFCCDDEDLCNGAGLTVVSTVVILSTTVISALMANIL